MTDPSGLLVTSAPLGWPDITVEQRYVPGSATQGEPPQAEGPQVLVWQEPVLARVHIAGHDLALRQSAGGMVIVPGGAVARISPERPGRYLRMILSQARLDATAAEVLGPQPFAILPHAGPVDFTFSATGHLLLDAATGRQPLDLAMIDAIVREIAVHLLHTFSNCRFDRTDLKGRLPAASLVRVLGLIGDHLHEPLTLDRMAREAGVSRSHFARAFAKSVGRTPHAYVMSRRVAKAAHLLHHSSDRIEQIAAQCGFHDQAHLSRQFRLRLQTTPSAYRLAARENRG